VAERVDVGVGVAVELDAHEVAGEAEPAVVADVEILEHGHVVHDRLGVVGAGRGVQRPGAAHGAARADQGAGPAYVLGGEVVEGAALVVRSPAPPVLAGFVDVGELAGRDRLGARGRCHGG
jgi:hypothetical protein